ncbi:hypothetical protein [Rhizobium terrae]|uniref:hypothetical protein n=1 Tax=Rhizobium terrae TaxID=2171756 RepID=UPI0013C2D6E9|nr:hypothetical protein [Rhizobium terrae]
MTARSYFQPHHLQEFAAERKAIDNRFRLLRERFLNLPLTNKTAAEHAVQGYSRRLDTMHRCIEVVFDKLPPARTEPPSNSDRTDGAIYIQAFVMNAFGALENLAWVWALERDIRQTDGSPLKPMMIGMTKNHKQMWRSLPLDFREYLLTLETWFAVMTDFRDSLAHRIPLYIPPFVVDLNDLEEYQRLGRAAADALRDFDLGGYTRLKAEQQSFHRYRPWMKHSFEENSKPFLFHAQLLADFNTIAEIGSRLADMLDMAP